MRIVLIDPNDKYIGRRQSIGKVVPLLGLAYIATALKTGGHHVDVIDPLASNMRDDAELADAVAAGKPDLVGLTSTTPFAQNAYRIAKLAKESYPSARVLLGGHHASAVKDLAFDECEAIDFIVIGEGEKTVVDLADQLGKGGELAKVAGLARRADGGAVVGPDREGLDNLDRLPFPDWSLYSYDLYDKVFSPKLAKRVHVYQVLSSRGCPADCTFCYQIFGQSYRSRSPENVVSEIVRNSSEFGAVYFDFVDPTLTMNAKKFAGLCDGLVKAGLSKKIAWTFETRVDRVDSDILAQAVEAGAESVLFGIESGDSFVRGKMRKKITEDEIMNAVNLADRSGLLTKASFIIGHPYESRESAFNSLKTARALRENWSTDILAGLVGVYPDTVTWQMVETGEGGARWREGVRGNWERSVRTDPMIEVNDLDAQALTEILHRFQGLRNQ
ncbi:MAG: B12-binding domain-containing radical SAM protein [Terriglobia bacterium]